MNKDFCLHRDLVLDTGVDDVGRLVWPRREHRFKNLWLSQRLLILHHVPLALDLTRLRRAYDRILDLEALALIVFGILLIFNGELVLLIHL